jgi:aspartate racemase
MMQTKTIGILAGMGPRSTAPFIDLVVGECQRQYGATYDDEFPPMMIYALPTPFYVDRPIEHAALRAAIVAGLRRLAGTGVALIAMPCNTAHIYFDELAATIDVPLLNMVDLALRALPDDTGRVALLATRPTTAARVYQDALERAGRAVYLNETLQAQVDRLIQTIKTAPDRQAAIELWRDLLAALAANGLDTALLACTDLNAVSAAVSAPLELVDATACLAAATVRAWRALGNGS